MKLLITNRNEIVNYLQEYSQQNHLMSLKSRFIINCRLNINFFKFTVFMTFICYLHEFCGRYINVP